MKGEPISNLAEDHIFRKLFEFSVEGMIILDRQGVILNANPSCLAMFGYEKEELIGESVEKLFPSGYKVFYPVDGETNIAGKPILNGRHSSKETFPVSVSISCARTEAENLVIGFLIDLTERVKAEQGHAQFSRIFDESLNEIYILDACSWEFLTVNKGALLHLGYTLEEMRQMTIFDINPTLSRREIEEITYPLKVGITDKIQFETTRLRKMVVHILSRYIFNSPVIFLKRFS